MGGWIKGVVSIRQRQQPLVVTLCCLSILRLLVDSVSGIGISRGTQAKHPLPPSTVVNMVRDNCFQKVKLFDADSATLNALANSGIQVLVGIPNDTLYTLANSEQAADNWVAKNVSSHISSGGIDINMCFDLNYTRQEWVSLIDEDAKSIQPGNFERHWGLFGQPKYALSMGTVNSNGLVPARDVHYLARQWCIMSPSASLDDPQAGPSVSYACADADCTSLGYGTYCENLDALGNISYASISYYQ